MQNAELRVATLLILSASAVADKKQRNPAEQESQKMGTKDVL